MNNTLDRTDYACGCQFSMRTGMHFCRRHDPAVADRIVGALEARVRTLWPLYLSVSRDIRSFDWGAPEAADVFLALVQEKVRRRWELRALLRIRRAGRA